MSSVIFKITSETVFVEDYGRETSMSYVEDVYYQSQLFTRFDPVFVDFLIYQKNHSKDKFYLSLSKHMGNGFKKKITVWYGYHDENGKLIQ